MIETPQKIVCVGLNYRDHAEEQGDDAARAAAALRQVAEHTDRRRRADPHPAISQNVDYEAELGVVIGRQAKGVTTADALDHVRGLRRRERRLGSRPAVRRRPVGARQVARHVPAGRRARARRPTCPTRRRCRSARS